MKRNLLNLVIGTALTLTMTNTSQAMKAESNELENNRPLKKSRPNNKQAPSTKAENLFGGEFTLRELFALEGVSKALHSALQNAPQYKALIKGWEEIPDSHNKSYKEKFLYLHTEIPEYKVHLANLWFNFFPLEGSDLKLSHYWGMRDFSSIPKLLDHLNKMHLDYLQIEPQQPAYRSLASLGWAITLPKLNKDDQCKTNYFRLNLLNTIFQDAENFSADQRNTARYNWIEHAVKHALVDPTTPPFSYTAAQAREDYGTLLADQNTPSQTRLSVIYHMAELDFLGFGNRDLKAAEDGFLTVSNHPDAHIFTKTLSKPYLAKIEAAKKEISLQDIN